MKGDFSRLTFDRKKHYSAVRFQQGRVQLDADLNEEQDIQRHRVRIEARDVIGWSGVPKHGDGFQIGVTADGGDLTISPGRIYVDGILCVAEATPVDVLALTKDTAKVAGLEADFQKFQKDEWVEIILEERSLMAVRLTKIDIKQSLFSFTPEIKPDDLKKIDPTKLKLRRLIFYSEQPDLVSAPKLEEAKYLAYLDVWEGFIGALDDPAIREKALGGPDTAGRSKTVWQVKLEKVGDDADCSQFGPDWKPAEAKADGKLSVRTAPVPTVTDPCLLPSQAGYRGLENQLYRVEIHDAGVLDQGKVTFKWSRDNGSVVASIAKISGATITVSSLGPDTVSGFNDNQWVEILDDRNELLQLPGEIIQIKKVDPSDSTIVLKSTPSTLSSDPSGIDKALHPKLRRWDGQGEIKAEIPATNEGWIILKNEDGTRENDLEIKFAQGTFRTGDYWIFPARTTVGSEIGSLEWPGVEDNDPQFLPPRGIHHHYAPLAIVAAARGKFKKPPLSDCRNPFPPLIEVTEGKPSRGRASCCTFVVGDGRESHGDFNDIEKALAELPEKGGQLCLLPGDHMANAVISGRSKITITGCGLRTKVSPKVSQPGDPVFSVNNSQEIVLSDLCLLSYEGTAVALKETSPGKLKDISIKDNWILAYENAVRSEGGSRVTIKDNQIRMLDKKGAGVAVYLEAQDCLVEWNDIALSRDTDDGPSIEIPNRPRPFNPHDPCAEFQLLYEHRPSYLRLSNIMFVKRPLLSLTGFKLGIHGLALGGIQAAAGAERIIIRENSISGGAGNGVTLGGRLERPEGAPAEEEKPSDWKPVMTSHEGRIFYGLVRLDDTPFPGAGIRFTDNQTDQNYDYVTDQQGYFRTYNLPKGGYTITALSPGYKAIKIATTDESPLRTITFTAIATRDDKETGTLLKSLAFLRDILIESNRIFGMGLSGIGMGRITIPGQKTGARVLRSMLAQQNPVWNILSIYSNPVIGLMIGRNTIARCLRASLDDELSAELKKKGMGGISLGICEDVTITENRIEENGQSPTPACGIFVAYGEFVEIALNRIQNNGKVLKGTKRAQLAPGFRGGIFLQLVSCFFDFDRPQNELLPTARGLFAAQVHGNIVSQPVGRALAIGSLGPTSVQDNYFDSQVNGPNPLEFIGGAVLLVNVGRSIKTVKQSTAAGNYLAAASKATATTASQLGYLFPGGGTLFENNQSHVGPWNQSILPHIIASADDVAFVGNQADSRQKISSPLVNVVVFSATARVDANRCQEPNQEQAASLISLTRSMNNTTDNQGDHCIFVLGMDPARIKDRDNLSLADQNVCKLFQARLQGLLG